MANSDSEDPNPKIDPEEKLPSNVNENGVNEVEPEEADDDEFEEEDEEDEEDDQEPPLQRKPFSEESRLRAEKAKLESLFRRISTEKVDLRVHDVLIKGNTKTKEYLIEAELEGIKKATTMQELLAASAIANANLRELEIFDSVRITLDSGPPELPGTTNVIVEVVETESVITGELGCYTKPAVCSLLLYICVYRFALLKLVRLGFCKYYSRTV